MYKFLCPGRRTTLREEILANQPIRQFRCNLAELILANREKIQIWPELILANEEKKKNWRELILANGG